MDKVIDGIYPQTNYTTQQFYTKEEYEKLQAENERLKEENNGLCKALKDKEFDRLIQSERKLKNLKQANNYKQALQEIREMATLFHSVNENKGLDRFKNNIIDKINEVIGAE